MPRILAIAVASIALSACAAEMSLEASGGAPTSSDSEATSSTPPPPYDSGGLAEPTPVWWSLDGSLALVGQEIDPLASTLQIDLWSADLLLLCTLDVPIDGALSVTPPATEQALVTWWSIDHLDGTSSASCGEWPAGTLSLGFGAYDPRLDPALDAQGLLGQDVFGLYLQLSPEDPVYVVGVAGTTDLLDGLTSTTTVPLPDDQYQLESLLVLPL